jgi:hypothetical protein
VVAVWDDVVQWRLGYGRLVGPVGWLGLSYGSGCWRLERWKVLVVMVSFSVFCVGWRRRRGERRESVGQWNGNG